MQMAVDAPTTTGGDGDAEMTAAGSADNSLSEEEKLREQEKKELEQLVDPEIKDDVGSSETGLYELVGAFLWLIPCVRPVLYR